MCLATACRVWGSRVCSTYERRRATTSRQRSCGGKPAAARACRQAVVHHTWSVAINRAQSVMLPCASMFHKGLPGPVAAPGTPGAGGCAPCPHAPVPSAPGVYSPGWYPVCQEGKGLTAGQAHLAIERVFRYSDRVTLPSEAPGIERRPPHGYARAL